MNAAIRPTSYLRPSLFWALGHGLLAVIFFRVGLSRALLGVPASLHAPLWVGFCVQSLALGFAAWLLTLPLLALGRGYAWAAPLLIALGTLALLVDSLLFEALGFHFNGLVLQVAMQKGAIAETGLVFSEVVFLVLGAVAFLAVDVLLGRFVLRRFAAPGKRAWAPALAVLGVWVVERLGMATLSFYGGHGVLAAGTTLPLQPPVRMNNFLRAVTGHEPKGELMIRELPQAGAPAGEVKPEMVRFTRKPDVVFFLIESVREDFFREDVMPNVWRRAHESGRIFPRHYASAASTHFSLFSIFYGLDAQRSDATIGAGQTPLLFPALRANGYDLSLIAASSVDWMSLRETVFKDVWSGMQTGLPGDGHERDAEMMRRARERVLATPEDQPLFLFLFFIGSHFNYSYPEDREVFTPTWDGRGSLAAATVDGALLKNRAMNAAHEVDRKIEEFLQFYEEARGGSPLVVITSDHGEEFREWGRVGHGSDVTAEQIHVPLVIFDEQMPPGIDEGVTGHVDLVPTLLALLGDENPPHLYSDGLPMHLAPDDRYMMATVGWEPRYAIVGKDLKVRFYSMDAGFGSARVTDPFDKPLEDGEARFAKEGSKILRRLRGGLGQGTVLASDD